jgi:N-formylglutamate amidohydrolase
LGSSIVSLHARTMSATSEPNSSRLSTALNRGLEVEVNRPYAGALVPDRWYQRDNRVSAVMIEINRRLYMNETMGKRRVCRHEKAVKSVVTGLIAAGA